MEQYPSDRRHRARKEGGKRCLGQIRDYVMTAANSVTRGQLGFYGGHLTDIIAQPGKKVPRKGRIILIFLHSSLITFLIALKLETRGSLLMRRMQEMNKFVTISRTQINMT